MNSKSGTGKIDCNRIHTRVHDCKPDAQQSSSVANMRYSGFGFRCPDWILAPGTQCVTGYCLVVIILLGTL